MEPVTSIASTITTLIFSEAFKEGGKALGKGVTEKVTQVITTIREKFKAVGREGILADAEEEPTQENQSEFKTVLEKQMTKDEAFANKLAELVKQLESTGVLCSDRPAPGSVITSIEQRGGVNFGTGQVRIKGDVIGGNQEKFSK